MVQHFPAYDFAITKGRQAQEILVGWRRGFFEQTAFLQKREFRLYNPYLRPGAQLVVRHGGQPYYLLFLHTDSGTEARDFGNRYEMFEKVWKLNAAVRRAEGDD
ncbi:MAG: hypothetical protein GWO39_07910, partial [Gammaproteobacteria bacterium]|nr:hypothetical protein [Gammaproteobacteria bacterium]NIT63702.1 hypothetical protein [Gammaproteobacteria bacterium]NIV20661.1 hypothetical protein [Gammaproteobacteria bacterium]NIY32282.1 hypothetical protein [Gammaproteobacteria bacterium]